MNLVTARFLRSHQTGRRSRCPFQHRPSRMRDRAARRAQVDRDRHGVESCQRSRARPSTPPSSSVASKDPCKDNPFRDWRAHHNSGAVPPVGVRYNGRVAITDGLGFRWNPRPRYGTNHTSGAQSACSRRYCARRGKQQMALSIHVESGHRGTDKLCDHVSDAILDAILAQDKKARVCVLSPSRRPAWSSSRARSRRRLGRHPAGRPQDGRDIGYTTPTRASTRHVRGPHRRRAAEPGHQPGRHRGRASTKEQGRGRPGPHVRLRVQRDPEPHAGADRLRAPARAPAHGIRVRREGRLAPPRRQEPGHARVRRRRAGPRGRHRRLSTQHAPRSTRRSRREGGRRARHRSRDPQEVPSTEHEDLRQPDGRFVVGGPTATRPHRPQDHRRHVRRHGPPRRRRVQRQGPDEGRPLRLLLRALRREERRRTGPRPSARSDRYAIGVGTLHRRLRSPGRSEFSWEDPRAALQLTADLLGGKRQEHQVVASSTNGTNNGYKREGSTKKKGKKGKKDREASA